MTKKDRFWNCELNSSKNYDKDWFRTRFFQRQAIENKDNEFGKYKLIVRYHFSLNFTLISQRIIKYLFTKYLIIEK